MSIKTQALEVYTIVNGSEEMHAGIFSSLEILSQHLKEHFGEKSTHYIAEHPGCWIVDIRDDTNKMIGCYTVVKEVLLLGVTTFKVKTIQDRLEEAIELTRTTADIHDFRVKFGNGMGAKLYHICRLDTKYPDLKLIEACRQSSEFLGRLDKERLQAIDAKATLKEYINLVATMCQ